MFTVSVASRERPAFSQARHSGAGVLSLAAERVCASDHAHPNGPLANCQPVCLVFRAGLKDRS